MAISEPLLDIQNLTVAYESGGALLPAVMDFSLQIRAGETVALVGESGSGKTTVALSIMRYLGKKGRIISGMIHFDGQDILALTRTALRDMWGKQIALVPQNPLASLNPSMRIGEQIAEILRRHEGEGRGEAAAHAQALLERVRVPDPQRVMQSYPHQISGGMQQRVLIAMALSTEPKLLILDEPTTGLDVTTQAAVLDLFRDLSRDLQAAVLYVSHNLGVVANICDRVAVLYAGEQVEIAPVGNLFESPLHPYTLGLLASVPRVGQTKEQVMLRAIPGQIPPLGQRPVACVFAPRCAIAVPDCQINRPALEAASAGHAVRCLRWSAIAAGELVLPGLDRRIGPKPAAPEAKSDPSLLVLADLDVFYKLRRPLRDVVRGKTAPVIKAVNGVNLDLAQGRTIGIVGESGSGKTSLAQAVIGLVERTGGDVKLLGIQLPAKLSARKLETLRHLQYVFQNPEEALNPHLTVGQALERPFVTLMDLPPAEAKNLVAPLLDAVSLPPDYRDRYPSQLSGGEKQRVAIARAFASAPELLIADEPVSALDVSVQASILNLLRDLQLERQNSIVLISHNLAVVGYFADEIAVMYLGTIMEVSAAANLFTAPMHPYTEALLAAIPTLDPGEFLDYEPLAGDVPSQMDVPTGCPFHTRCPRLLGDICRTDTPPWLVTSIGDRLRCHIPLADLEELQTR